MENREQGRGRDKKNGREEEREGGGREGVRVA